MELSVLGSPQDFLQQQLGSLPQASILADYQAGWEETGQELSAAIDRAGTPWLQMFDQQGERVDEILMPGGYRDLLLKQPQEESERAGEGLFCKLAEFVAEALWRRLQQTPFRLCRRPAATQLSSKRFRATFLRALAGSKIRPFMAR